jgi:[ribosomal protein S5]-alanine N-acetyltransferase
MTVPPTTVPVLETPRLVLRPFRASDAEPLHEVLGDPEAMRFWNVAPSSDLAATAKNLEWLAKYSPYSHAAWAVAAKADGGFLGMVNYHHREVRDRRIEIGYVIHRRFWRQGIAREAVSGLLRHCFSALACHRIEALIMPENTASRRLAESLGFRSEGGPLRDRWCIAGVYRSVMVYALLEEEWRAGS